MALSGSITTAAREGRSVTFSWTATQNVANNQSTISWQLKGSGQSTSSGGSYYVVVSEIRVTIDGTQAYYRSSNNHTNCFVDTVLCSGTKTLNHDSSGNKSFSVKVEAGIYQYAINVSSTGNFTLNQIPRRATITSAPNFNDEANPTIQYSNPAGSAVTKVEACISLNGTNDDIAYREISKTGTSYTFNLTTAERNVLRNATTTSTSRTIQFSLKTTISGNVYYYNVEKTLTIINCTPTVTGTIEDSRSKTYNLTGNKNKVVIGESNMAFTVTPTFLKGATQKSLKVTNGSLSKSVTSGTFYSAASNVFKCTVVDSRGNSVTQQWTKTAVNYFKPSIALSLTHVSTDGKMTASYEGKFFNGSFGSVNNKTNLKVKLYFKARSASTWTTYTYGPESYGIEGNYVRGNYVFNNLNYREVYELKAEIIDSMYTVTGDVQQTRSVPVFDWSKSDFNFNVPVNINGDLTVNGAVTSNTTTTSSTITPASGFSVIGWIGKRCKKNQNIVTITYGVTGTFNPICQIGTVPDGYRPTDEVNIIGRGDNTHACVVSIASNGVINYVGSATGGSSISSLSFSTTYIV